VDGRDDPDERALVAATSASWKVMVLVWPVVLLMSWMGCDVAAPDGVGICQSDECKASTEGEIIHNINKAVTNPPLHIAAARCGHIFNNI
jgi:hypothetical protein